MPKVDFKVDVDGFAFKNDWTFNTRERQEIHDIVHDALPAAAAIVAPILGAISPIVVAAAAPALGLLGPLLPLLPALAPVIAEKLVDAIADAISGEAQDGNLCSGMAFAATDYHRLKWVVPRGNALTDTPLALADGGTPASDALRKRIWDGQIQSHLHDTPRFVAWVATGLLLGDSGLAWLGDRTREELAKLDSKLAAGEAVPIQLVMRGDKPYKGHVVVATELLWIMPNWCHMTIYDNEAPDQRVVYEVDARGESAIVRRTDADRSYRALFCCEYAPEQPRPAVVVDTPLSLGGIGFVSEGIPVHATYAFDNDGFGDLQRFRAAIGTADSVLAAQPVTYDSDGKPVASFLPIGATDHAALDTAIYDPGLYNIVPLLLLDSSVDPGAVVRRLPNPDGSSPLPVSLRVNPRIPIEIGGAKRSFGCRRSLVEGEALTLSANLAPVAGRGVGIVQWTITGDLLMSGGGPSITIPALPPAPGHCRVEVAVGLSDGTQALGWVEVVDTDSATADRNLKLCELMNVVSHYPLANIPFGPAVDPLRLRGVIEQLQHAMQPEVLATGLQNAIRQLGLTRLGKS